MHHAQIRSPQHRHFAGSLTLNQHDFVFDRVPHGILYDARVDLLKARHCHQEAVSHRAVVLAFFIHQLRGCQEQPIAIPLEGALVGTAQVLFHTPHTLPLQVHLNENCGSHDLLLRTIRLKDGDGRFSLIRAAVIHAERGHAALFNVHQRRLEQLSPGHQDYFVGFVEERIATIGRPLVYRPLHRPDFPCVEGTTELRRRFRRNVKNRCVVSF